MAKYQGNGKLFLEVPFIDPRKLLPGKNHVTDPSARDHPSAFLLALKETGRNSFPQLPLNSAFAGQPLNFYSTISSEVLFRYHSLDKLR
jgi:hypothetical protein